MSCPGVMITFPTPALISPTPRTGTADKRPITPMAKQVNVCVLINRDSMFQLHEGGVVCARISGWVNSIRAAGDSQARKPEIHFCCDRLCSRGESRCAIRGICLDSQITLEETSAGSG